MFSLLLSHTSMALIRKLWVYILPMFTSKRICPCFPPDHILQSLPQWIITLEIINECRCNHSLFASRLEKFLHSILMGRPLNISFVWKRKQSGRKKSQTCHGKAIPLPSYQNQFSSSVPQTISIFAFLLPL